MGHGRKCEGFVENANRFFEALGPLWDHAFDHGPSADRPHIDSLVLMKLRARHESHPESRDKPRGAAPNSSLMVEAAGSVHHCNPTALRYGISTKCAARGAGLGILLVSARSWITLSTQCIPSVVSTISFPAALRFFASR